MKSKLFVNELVDKQQIASYFLVTNKSLQVDKNSKKFLNMILSDITGSINARMWEGAEQIESHFDVGQAVEVKGHIQNYQGRLQVVVHDLSVLTQLGDEWRQLIKGSAFSTDDMLQELDQIVEKVSSTWIRQLLKMTLSSPEWREKLRTAPAARSVHHAFVGGLLEHTLSICRIMQSLAVHYEYLDLDYLLFGAIYHDIGKIEELKLAGGIQYTDEGRLVGHMGIALKMLDDVSREIPNFPEEILFRLKHIVLSHHGRLEYGSPKTPQFLEAVVVAMIDELDSRLNNLSDFMLAELKSGPTQKWTRLHSASQSYYLLDILRERLK